MPREKINNMLSFDIEDWYHPNLAKTDCLRDITKEDRVKEPTLRILNLLDETKNSATFFILGEVAQRFPALVTEIANRGHEVASHGFCHNLVYNYTKDQFETDINKALKTLTDITGQEILGYRAPSWSLGKDTPWAWGVLHDSGFIYDSSVFPFKTFLYGDSSAPRFDYGIGLDGDRGIREVPPSVMRISGQRVPFSGGFYFRILPYQFIKAGIQQYNNLGKPSLLYVHPWEMDVGQPRLNLPARDRFIMYANIKRTEKKLRKVLQDYRFVSIKDYFDAAAPQSQSHDISLRVEVD